MPFSGLGGRKQVSTAGSVISLVLLVAGLAAGCGMKPAATGTFDKTLTVDGPVRFELTTGSGDIEITTGPPGQVRIHGDFRVNTFFFGGTKRRVEAIRDNPPIEQHGNVITVGADSLALRNVSISYRITVPQETLLRARAGSGDVIVRGLKGPVKLGTGSGDVTAENIGDEAEVSTGSGHIRVKHISGPVTANTGSGAIDMDTISGPVRTRTGSGSVTLARLGGRAEATTGSGDVRISDVTADVRVSTGSGDLTVDGNPSAQSYWELHTNSGAIRIDVPESASFRLYARSNSGNIVTNIPLTIEEQNRRSLRARAGSGAARIEADTGSGGIRIR